MLSIRCICVCRLQYIQLLSPTMNIINSVVNRHIFVESYKDGILLLNFCSNINILEYINTVLLSIPRRVAMLCPDR